MTASRKKREGQSPDALELIVTWISGALLAGMLAFLVWDARRPSQPPSFETSIESRAQRGSYAYVTVAVRNLGDDAARAVEVRVVPEAAETGAEAHFTLDWLPGRSTRRGIAVLPQSVGLGRLRAEVAGYAEP
jgi:uncharacterized protein (TIGR02588 family)